MKEVRDYAEICGETAPKKQMAEVQSELTDLADSYHALLRAHKRLRSRIGMREIREKKANGGAEEVPDSPNLDDEVAKAAYKKQLRNDLRAKGLLK